MKKATLMAFLLAALAPMMQAWANGSFYARLTVMSTSNPTGSGMVYVGSSAATSSSTYKAMPTYADNSASAGSNDSSKKVTLYVAAKANYGSVFSGWYENEAGTGTPKSTETSYSYSITSQSKDAGSPTPGTLYAKFSVNTESYTLTLNKPIRTSYCI